MEKKTLHELKILPEYFEAIWFDYKQFEIRKNDRDFHVGDILLLKEWLPVRGYTGAVIRARVNYILQDVDGLDNDYCILSFTKLYASFLEEEDSL